MNVRTGKAGYHKRIRAHDRSTSLDVTVHDSHEAVGAAPDLGNRVFKQATQAVTQNQPEAIDAGDIPFFQHPAFRFAPVSAGAASSSSTSMFALPSLPPVSSSVAISEIGPDDATENQVQHDSEGEDTVMPALINPLDAIHSAIPCHARETRAASKVTPAPKPASTASRPKPGGVSGSSKKRTMPNAEDKGSEPKIMRLDTSKAGDITKSSGGNPHEDTDKKVIAECENEYFQLKRSSLASLKDTDAGVADTLKAASRSLVAFINKVKTKKKSFKRRKDKESLQSLNDAFDKFVDDAQHKNDMVISLDKMTGDEETLKILQSLDSDWAVGMPIFQRCFKCIALNCLKFRDWGAFYALKDTIIHYLRTGHGEVFFERLVSDLIQRLLRALPSKVFGSLIVCH